MWMTFLKLHDKELEIYFRSRKSVSCHFWNFKSIKTMIVSNQWIQKMSQTNGYLNVRSNHTNLIKQRIIKIFYDIVNMYPPTKMYVAKVETIKRVNKQSISKLFGKSNLKKQ